jgi:hypothetical protein
MIVIKTGRLRLRSGGAEQPVEAQASVEVKPEPVLKPEEPPAAPPAAVIAMPEAVNDYRQSVTRRRQGNEAQLRLS